MKILYYLDGLNRGGVENVVLQLSQHISKMDYDIHVVYMYEDHDDLVKDFPNSVKLHCLKGTSTGSHYLQYISKFSKLSKLLKEINPEIIHAHNSSFSYLFLALAVKRAGISPKNIRTLHFSGFFLLKNTYSDIIKFNLDKCASQILKTTFVPVSLPIAELVHQLYPKNKYITIENGIDTVFKFNGINRNKADFNLAGKYPVCNYTSRICQGKNHITLLRAWQIVCSKYPDAMLLLVGDGPIEQQMFGIAKELGITSNVSFIGSVTNVQDYLGVSDIGIFPSESEGFSLGLLEMMAMRLPVIASSIPAFKGIIKDGLTGIIYDTFNPKDLANKILALAADPNLQSSLGLKARESTEKKYSIENMIQKYLSLYRIIKP